MPRRIEIELTSARPDGTWTWRAAGAREPRGILDGTLLPGSAKPGDVLKADADFELEGIVITSVTAPRPESRTEAQRIEIVGPGRPDGPGVTTQLVGRGDRRPADRRRDREDGRERRRERAPGHPQTGRPERGQAPERGDADRPSSSGQESGGARRGGPGGERRERPGAREATGAGGRPGRRSGEQSGRPAGDRRPEEGGARTRDRRPADSGRSASQSERVRGRRLNPGSTHRRAVMDSLAPEEQAIAEQVLRGGIPAVRTALHLEREKAEAEGRPAPNTDELIAMAEALLPRLRAAEWRDRAEAAAADVDGISMRDLRSIVAGADVARDDETRALGATLREALERRVQKLHQDWAAEVTGQLDANKVVRAVRLASRPPEPGARLDPELTSRLTDAASTMMGPTTAPDLWAALLEAVAESPIRRSVTPAGLPENAPPDLKRSAHQHSGSIPALGKLLGVTIPPPPPPPAARRRPAPPPPAASR